MSKKAVDALKVEAANSVLSRLGEKMFEILKEELAKYHEIILSDGASFTVEELQIALQKIVGDGAAKWLTIEIQAEIDYQINERSEIERVLAQEQKF